MYSSSIKSTTKPLKSRLGLKLTALFIASFLIVFTGLLFLDLLATMGEGVLVDSAVSSQPAVTAIDPKLESELAKVLEYSDVQNTADIKNPFADQSGISNQLNPAAVQTAVPATASSTTVNPAAVSDQQREQSRQNIAANSIQPNPNVVPDPQAETRARLQLREERIRLGQDGGPEAAVFAIDDLLPVGTVGGGEGQEEVMFYSQSACRVISFPVGTQFYDGWFDSMRSEGVVFGFFDRTRTMRMRAWGRSVTPGCSQSLLTTPSSEQTLTAGGGD